MPEMTFHALMKELKSGVFHPVYVLHGEESYFIDSVSNYLENDVLSETEKGFNLTILYGRDTTANEVINASRRYPVMASRQVVIVREAQDMNTGNKKELDKLATYLEKPAPTTILALCHKNKSIDKRSAFFKLAKKKAVILEARRIYENQIPDWIHQYVRERGLTIDREAAQLLAEYLGNDLSKVVNELEKILLNKTREKTITPADVHKYSGISKDYNVFELQRALAARDFTRAYRIVEHMAANPKAHPFVLITGMLYNFFSKLLIYHAHKKFGDKAVMNALGVNSPWFLREYKTAEKYYNFDRVEKIIDILHEYDLRSKGYNDSNTPAGELLKEMVIKILN